MSSPEKRAASETASRLLAPPRYDPAMQRPATTVVGTLLVLLRVAAGVLQTVEIAVTWGSGSDAATIVLDGVDASPDLLQAGLIAFVAVSAVVLFVDAVFAVLIYRGRNLPRVLVMVVTVVSISAAFAGWWTQGQEITLRTSLLSLALDILILLALSSRSAAAYARRNETG